MTLDITRNCDELGIQFNLKIPNKLFLCRTNIRSHQTGLHSSQATEDGDLLLTSRDISDISHPTLQREVNRAQWC